jgi:hypothetical protein
MRGTCDPHLTRSENSLARVGVKHMIVPRTEQVTEKGAFYSEYFTHKEEK